MVEKRDQHDGASARDAAREILGDWREILKAAVDDAEKFVRQKPLAGAAIAFAAGWMLCSLFKK